MINIVYKYVQIAQKLRGRRTSDHDRETFFEFL
jgi:hypothetical protein